MDVKKKLNDTLVWLVFNDPLLQEFVDMIKFERKDEIRTAGVSVDDDYINIAYNEKFIDDCDDDGLRFLVKHELYHVILAHVFSRLDNHEIDNIAADIEINQEPFAAPSGAIKNYGVDYKKFELPSKESREFYYKKLLEQSQNKGGGSGCDESKGQSLDDHSQWAKQDDYKKELWKQKIKQGVESAKQKGNISGDLISLIGIKWKKHKQLSKILKRIVGKHVSNSSVETTYWRKRDKRYSSYPGTRDCYGANIIIAVDTSGSMSDSDLIDVYNVIKWIKRNGYGGTVIQCDCAIQSIDDIRKVKSKIKLNGRGGTSSKPVFDYVEKHNLRPDMLMYFSDMDIDYPKDAPKYKVVWIDTSRNENVSATPFGKVVKL